MSVSTNVPHEATTKFPHHCEATVTTDTLDSSRPGDDWEDVEGAGANFYHLPPPSMIRAYEAVRPGTGEWLLRMAEERIQQRRQEALDALAESYRWKRLVAWLLIGTALAVLAAAMILLAKGHPDAAIGTVVGWTTVVAIAACLAWLRRHNVGAWSRPAIRDKTL